MTCSMQVFFLFEITLQFIKDSGNPLTHKDKDSYPQICWVNVG